MKKMILSAIVACLCLPSFAQDCKNYYLLQNNKTIEISSFNKKGKNTGKQVYKISDVKTSGDKVTATLETEFFDKKGKSAATGNAAIECNDGIMKMDMSLMIPQQQQSQFSQASAKADKIFIEYPANMKVGDQLKEGLFEMETETGGMKQAISMIINDRKVESKETITTPAGSWECFKIAYKSKISVKTMGIGIPINSEITEWYAPGFGIVKTETKYGYTEITAIH